MLDGGISPISEQPIARANYPNQICDLQLNCLDGNCDNQRFLRCRFCNKQGQCDFWCKIKQSFCETFPWLCQPIFGFCPPGYHIDSETGQCVKDGTQPRLQFCPPNYHLDSETGKCIPNQPIDGGGGGGGQRRICPPGFILNVSTFQCEPINPNPPPNPKPPPPKPKPPPDCGNICTFWNGFWFVICPNPLDVNDPICQAVQNGDNPHKNRSICSVTIELIRPGGIVFFFPNLTASQAVLFTNQLKPFGKLVYIYNYC